MSVSIKDIAKVAGVSPATVSLALNDNPLVNAKTKRKIQQIANEMGYIPNMYAKRLIGKGCRIIGLIVPNLVNLFYSALVEEFSAYARLNGYGFNIAISQNSALIEAASIREMIHNNVDGLIIVPMDSDNYDTAHFESLDKAEIPYIFAASKYEGVAIPCVMSDYEKGAYEAVQYIKSLKYTNPVFISGPDGIYSFKCKNNGFRRAIADIPEYAKLNMKTLYHLNEPGYEMGARVAVELYNDNVETDMIFAANDLIAVGIINAVRRLGVEIPENVSVMGFDNTIFATLSPVPVTSVAQNIPQIAKQATDLLIDIISGEKPSTADILIPTTIFERESSINYHCEIVR